MRFASGDTKSLRKQDVQISRIHTNRGHPQKSTLAKMISDAGGSEEMI